MKKRQANAIRKAAEKTTRAKTIKRLIIKSGVKAGFQAWC